MTPLKIQILGSGCPTCEKLHELVKETVAEMKLEAEVEYITDILKIAELGILQTPVLVINGRPVMAGVVSDKENIKLLIADETSEIEEGSCGCNCGGHCH